MSIADEARAESESRYPATYRYDGDELPNRGYGDMRIAFMDGAQWALSRTPQPVQVEVTDEVVERAFGTIRLVTIVPASWASNDAEAEQVLRDAVRAALTAALGGGDPVACNCTQSGAHDYGSEGCESGAPQPSTDQTWREAAQIVLAEVKINGEPALEFIDRIVAATPTQPSTVTEALTDAEWREFQSIPDQGYSHRAWVDHKIAQRVDAARLTPAQPEQVTTVEELDALPVGSVVMSIMADPFEQRVWQKFGGEPDWQFGMSRHEWQCTDGGFVRVGNSPVFNTGPRTLTVLYRPAAVTPESGERR